ncbi:MAG: hypothetical protein AAFW68_12435 [Pseudomonadota bacterium]
MLPKVPEGKMTRRLKLMTGLSTLAAASALTLSGCGGEGEGGGEAAEADTVVAAGEGEGESAGVSGEAEGGEGESEGEGATRSGDPATDNVAYVKLLGLVRGHLIAFIELYQSGERDMALTHVKHPESELYASLTPAFAARGMPGFADALTALSNTAEAGGEITDAYSAVIEAISAHTPNMTISEQLLAVSEIVRTAGDEFDIAVEDDGAITNLHEYQDAYGFLIASRDILSGLETTDMNAADAISLAHEQVELALALFAGLTEETTEGTPSTLYGAAARIEIAARGLS